MIATAHVQTYAYAYQITCDIERTKNTCVSYICIYTLLSLSITYVCITHTIYTIVVYAACIAPSAAPMFAHPHSYTHIPTHTPTHVHIPAT